MPTPVVLFAYNRAEALERTLAALRAAGARELVVFADGARPGDEEEVARVRALVEAVDWAEVELVARESNLGLSASIVSGLGWMFERHERALVVEDDVVLAPEFLPFAEAALDRYADEERVVGVSALRLPFPRRAVDRYPYDAFMLPRFFSWGWATWARAWRTLETDGARVLERLRERPVALEAAGADLPRMVRAAFVEGTLRGSWDVACAASMVLNGQLFVVPAWNMAENAGFEVGTHPQAPRWRLRWETERRPPLERLRLPPVEVDDAILDAFRVWRENPRGWTWRRLVPRPARMVARRVRGTYDVFR